MHKPTVHNLYFCFCPSFSSLQILFKHDLNAVVLHNDVPNIDCYVLQKQRATRRYGLTHKSTVMDCKNLLVFEFSVCHSINAEL